MIKKKVSAKWLVCVLMSVAIIAGLLSALTLPVGAERSISFHVSTGDEFKEALKSREKTTVPYTIFLDGDIELGRTDIKNQNVSVDLCGHTINGVQDSNSLFVISTGATATFKDSVGTGKVVYKADTVDFGANVVFRINDGGKGIFESGTYIVATDAATPGYVIQGDNILINGGEFRNETGFTKEQRNGCVLMWTGTAEIKNASFYSPTEGLEIRSMYPSTPTTVTVDNCTFETGREAIAIYDALLTVGESYYKIGNKYCYAVYANSMYNEENVMTFLRDGYKAYVDGKLLTETKCTGIGDFDKENTVVEITDKIYVSNPEITELDVPTHGKEGDYTASTDNPNCKVTGISYVMFGKKLDPYVGSKGDNIGIAVTVKAADGYTFPKVTKAMWNEIESHSATVNAEGNECVYLFPYSVGADAEAEITALSVTVEEPKTGNTPAKTAEVGKGTKLESLTWEPADEVFKEGVGYTVTAKILPDDTHLLSTDFIIEYQKGTVNGNQAVVTKPASTGGGKDKFLKGIVVSYTFPPTAKPAKAITSVEITGIDVPAVGKTPDMTAKSESEEYTVGMTVWADESDKMLSEDAVFEAGKFYKVGIEVTSAEGMAFTEGTSATVDGEIAGTVFDGTAPNRLLVFYTFPELPDKDEEPVEEYKFPFTDVADSAWYRKDVEIAHKNGLVNGKTATRFYPDDNMTYAEAVKLACAMHQLYYDKKVTLTSGELTWYSTYMEYALEKGIIDKDLTSVANEKITRRDFVKIFYAALPDSEYEVMNEVADGAIPDVAKNDESAKQIYAFYRAGILTGSDGYGTFYPKNNIVRREVAAILTRMFDSGARKAITLK